MKKLITAVAITTIFTLFLGAEVAFAGLIANRQIRQQERIHQGIRSGALTLCEVRGLERQQLRIQNHRLRAWSDGRLMPYERILLEREQNRACGNIYRLKHNDVWR